MRSFSEIELDDLLYQFYHRSEIWFSVRNSLHHALQPVINGSTHLLDQYPNVQINLEMDNILSRHPTFSELLPLLRQMHAFVLNRARQTGVLPSASAAKSVYYFVSHFKQAAANRSLALELYTMQSNNFFQRRTNDNDPGFAENVLGQTEPAQFLPKICNVTAAERYISLHAFGEIAPESLISFQNECCAYVPTQLEAISDILPLCLNETNATALKLIYDWSRFVISMQAPSYVLFGIQKLFFRTYEDALPNATTSTQRTGSAIYMFHFLRSIQSKHFPLWTQFDRALHSAFWTVARSDLSVSRSYPFLIRVFILFLFGRFVGESEINEHNIHVILRSITQLSHGLSDGKSNRFLKYARKTLVERRVWNIDTERDVAVNRSLREVFDLERGHIASFDENTEFCASELENVPDGFKRYVQHHKPNGDFHWGVKRRSQPELTSITTVEEKDCGIQTKSSRVLKLPREIKELQQYVSSFHRIRYPHRRLSHVNYLSTLVIETSTFSQRGSIEIRCNVYQAMVLFLFQTENRRLSYRRMTERLISSKASSEDYDNEKVRIRQAVLSLTSQSWPLLVQHEGREGSSSKFSLNTAFYSTQDLDIVQSYQDAYLFSLDRTDEWKVRQMIDPVVMNFVSGNRHIPREALVSKMMQEWLHPLITEDFVRRVVQQLTDAGRIVLDDEGKLCAATGVRDYGVYVED